MCKPEIRFWRPVSLEFGDRRRESEMIGVCVSALSRSVMSHCLQPHGVAHQAPLSMGFPRQEYWSGLPFPSPGDLFNSGIEPAFLALAGRFFITEPPGKPTLKFVHTHPGQCPEIKKVDLSCNLVVYFVMSYCQYLWHS